VPHEPHGQPLSRIFLLGVELPQGAARLEHQRKADPAMNWTRTCAAAALLAIALSVRAQNAPEHSASPDEEPPKLTKPVLDLSLEYASALESGSGHAMSRYTVPASGLLLRRLELRPQLPPNSRASLSASYAGQADRRTEARLAISGRVDLSFQESRFRFREADPGIDRASSREAMEMSAKYQLAPGLSTGVTFRLDESVLRDVGPHPLRRTRSNLFGVSMSGRLGGGFFSLGFTDWTHSDLELPGSGVDTARLSANVSLPLGRDADLGYALSRARIDPDIGPDGIALSDAATLAWRLGPATTFEAHGRRETLNLPGTRTVSVRERVRTGAAITHRLPGWSLQASFSEADVERYRRDRRIVERPKWRTFEAKAVGRLPGDARLVVRYRTQDVSGRPESILSDPRSTYRSGRSSLDVRFGSQFGALSAYADLQISHVRNRGRGVDIESVGSVVGAFVQVGERLEVFAEVAVEDVGADSDVGGPRPLAAYWPGTESATLGAHYRFDPATTVSATFTVSRTDGDNPLAEPQGKTRARTFTLSLVRQEPSGGELSLTYAPAAFRDDQFGEWNSRVSVWRFTYTRSF
jgi:hypothetical protein